MSVDISQINEKIARESVFIEQLTSEMSKVIIGQRHMVDARAGQDAFYQYLS